MVAGALEIIISNSPIFSQAVFKVQTGDDLLGAGAEYGLFKVKKENLTKQRFGKKAIVDVRVDSGIIKYVIKW